MPGPTATAFSTEAFAAISEDPVTDELAARFQAALALHDVTGGGGMSATVMTPVGTWSGTTGKADGVRDLKVDDQFTIASITKSVVALCAGEIVSQASLTEMSTFEPAEYIGSYGLGVYNPADGYALAFGYTGQFPGYMTWAACLPEDEAVIVVLTNHEVDDGHFAWSHGLARPLVDALRSR